MSRTVPNAVYVGFTASTGLLQESHQLLDRVFVSFPIEFDEKGQSKVDEEKEEDEEEDIENRARSAANVPILFSYKQLQKATHNFSKENLLGKGEREYLAEICTIGRLRHKNLVQLRGWCHEREHLLLVYEYMANGSLDLFIGKGFLDWKTRYKILTGLASALLYLHEEWEFDEEQVKRTLTVGFASLHPDCMLRPKIRKVVQIFLNPNEPLMDLPHARPNAVYVSVSSASTADVGSSSVATADETRTPDDKA
ncbi:hypothetical protein WN943_000322 [Citrus x changshan-huyou]